tara:strand:- start:8411 stop:8629 length:219 start_codon:yes stop_codon:yes gene_type:complete
LPDIFNLAAINGDIFFTIGKLSSLHSLCEEYIRDLNEEKGEEIAKTIEDIEVNLDKVKRDIVKMLFMFNEEE